MIWRQVFPIECAVFVDFGSQPNVPRLKQKFWRCAQDIEASKSWVYAYAIRNLGLLRARLV